MGGATKILLTTCAPSFTKDLMSSQTWPDCCSKAMDSAINFRFSGIKNYRTIQRCYQDFRVKRKIKANNLPGRHNLPPFLQQSKDICIKIQQCTHENLSRLSIKLIVECMYHAERMLAWWWTLQYKKTTNASWVWTDKYKCQHHLLLDGFP